MSEITYGSMVAQAETYDARMPARLGYVDAARGIATLAMIFAGFAQLPFGAAEKFAFTRLASVVEPFATPAFCVIAGLMLQRALRDSWPRYFMRKVAPFVWRYVMWATLAALAMAALQAPLNSTILGRVLVGVVIEPPQMLVILCGLALAFFAARLARGWPVLIILPIAATLEIALGGTGGPIPASFFRCFVYLYVGHVFAPEIRMLARRAAQHRAEALSALLVWTIITAFAALAPIPFTDEGTLATLPFASLGFGLAGAAAIIATASLVEGTEEAGVLRWIGVRALPIYLAGFVGFVALRVLAIGWPVVFAPGAGLIMLSAAVLAATLAVVLAGRPPQKQAAPEGDKSSVGNALARIASRLAPR